MDKKNIEGYTDLTPYEALRHKVSQVDIDDARRMDKAIKSAKRTFSIAGFDVIGRITLKNKRTGKIHE
jgi:hypothetical protein